MANASRRSRVRWRLSLIMPAYNEEAGIEQAVAEANEALADLDYEYEILVIDDGSLDSTAVRVADMATALRTVRLIRHVRNFGYGAALRTGFENARFDRVAFTDADAQFYLEDLDDLMPLTLEYPIVAGYRIDRKDPWRRRFLSRGYNWLVRKLLGTQVRDCDCALKVFRTEVLDHIMPETDGFFVNAEMLCKANRLGIPIAEVGVRHRPRRHGSSKVSLLDIPRTLLRLVPFWLSHVVVAARPQPVSLPEAELPAVSSRRARSRRPIQPR
jgi:glycosyltransferase involved in cell wall biosynthesis